MTLILQIIVAVRPGRSFHLLVGPLAFLLSHIPMAKAISDNKKSRGRPITTGTSPLIGVRLPADQLAGLDALRQRMSPPPSRPEIIRQIVAAALLAAHGRSG